MLSHPELVTNRVQLARAAFAKPRRRRSTRPIIKNPPMDCYCKKTWPGGIVCVPKGAGAPSNEWQSYGGSSAGSGTGGGANCYGNNMAKSADVASTGTYFGDVAGGAVQNAMTDRTRQDIKKADDALDRGEITQAQRDAKVGAAMIRARAGAPTGIRPTGARPQYAKPATRGYDGRVIHTAELTGTCQPPPRGPVCCKTAWPGGILGCDSPVVQANPSQWTPISETISDRSYTDRRTGKTTVVRVASYDTGGACYPNGKPWWTKAGAWATRAAIRAAEETRDLIHEHAADLARHAQAIASGRVRNMINASRQTGGLPPLPIAGGLCCKIAWPGGILGCDSWIVQASPGQWVPCNPDGTPSKPALVN